MHHTDSLARRSCTDVLLLHATSWHVCVTSKQGTSRRPGRLSLTSVRHRRGHFTHKRIRFFFFLSLFLPFFSTGAEPSLKTPFPYPSLGTLPTLPLLRLRQGWGASQPFLQHKLPLSRTTWRGLISLCRPHAHHCAARYHQQTNSSSRLQSVKRVVIHLKIDPVLKVSIHPPNGISS